MASHGTTASAEELAHWLETDATLLAEVQADPRSLEKYVAPTQKGADLVYLLAVAILGVTIIIVVAGSFWLANSTTGDVTQKIPDALLAIGAAAVGALAGLLAPFTKK